MISDDPTVTDPDNYKTLWENELVRVLEYRDHPGTRTTPHRHPNSVMVTLSDFSRRVRPSDLRRGEGRSVPRGTRPSVPRGAEHAHD